MNTRKFKIIADGQFRGFIFFSDNNPHFPNCKVATIWPFDRIGNWEDDDLEIIGQRNITDLYQINIEEDVIINQLIERANINRGDFQQFQIIPFA